MAVRSLPVLLAGRSSGLVTPDCSVQQLTGWALSQLSVSRHNSLDISHHSAPITCLALDPEDAQYLAAGAGDGTLYVHDVRGGELALHIGRSHRHNHKYSIASVSWGVDTGILISSSRDGVMKVWDPNNPRKPVGLFVVGRRLYRHAVSGCGTLVAAGRDSGHVTVVDLRSGSTSHVLRGGHQTDSQVFSLAWSLSQPTVLATGAADNNILLWDVRRADSCIMKLDCNKTSSTSSTSRTSTSSTSRTSTSTSSRTRQGARGGSHQGPVVGLAWSQCGRWLVSVGGDNKVRRWDSLTGTNLNTPFPPLAAVGKQPVDVVCSSGADRDSLFVAEKAGVRVFQLETGKDLGTLSGHYSSVTALVYSQHRLQLYSGGRDKHILRDQVNNIFNMHFNQKNPGGFRIFILIYFDDLVQLWPSQQP